jgi:hypothetical protein
MPGCGRFAKQAGRPARVLSLVTSALPNAKGWRSPFDCNRGSPITPRFEHDHEISRANQRKFNRFNQGFIRYSQRFRIELELAPRQWPGGDLDAITPIS